MPVRAEVCAYFHARFHTGVHHTQHGNINQLPPAVIGQELDKAVAEYKKVFVHQCSNTPGEAPTSHIRRMIASMEDIRGLMNTKGGRVLGLIP
jgi:hypothetical protein